LNLLKKVTTKVALFSESLVTIYQTSRVHIVEDCKLYIHRLEHFNSRMIIGQICERACYPFSQSCLTQNFVEEGHFEASKGLIIGPVRCEAFTPVESRIFYLPTMPNNVNFNRHAKVFKVM
jgi:hypothetical protein